MHGFCGIFCFMQFEIISGNPNTITAQLLVSERDILRGALFEHPYKAATTRKKLPPNSPAATLCKHFLNPGGANKDCTQPVTVKGLRIVHLETLGSIIATSSEDASPARLESINNLTEDIASATEALTQYTTPDTALTDQDIDRIVDHITIPTTLDKLTDTPE